VDFLSSLSPEDFVVKLSAEQSRCTLDEPRSPGPGVSISPAVRYDTLALFPDPCERPENPIVGRPAAGDHLATSLSDQ